ncbi:DsbA family oxidoreductase [Candidatus Uabimicrobium amorphum]|uniref:FrnE protein n=1 Tax=Uabimicrobium amorphum TaxID=2596890 RepID=A0A5S9F4M9_UABAM|nr:DsbA family oxidoreductase [Candidatus Uabimicrobium amorphum]BBM84402.1 frnE protein [Candidatus Uabimicrobium amorphum]
MTDTNVISEKKLRIDIVSDVVCPWCIIGYKRLEKALEIVGDKVEADIHWHPFELNSKMPQGGENLRSHLAAKYGTTLEGSIKARASLTKIGAALGFKFDYFDEMKMFNTFKAHQILHYARTKGKETELKLRLFSAFFGERQEIDQVEVLVSVAEEIGLDAAESREILNDGRYANAVREEEYQWLARGVRGVPAFVFDDKHIVSGAQDPETLASTILQLHQ